MQTSLLVPQVFGEAFEQNGLQLQLPHVCTLQGQGLQPLQPLPGHLLFPHVQTSSQHSLLEKMASSIPPPQQLEAWVSTTNPSNAPANTTAPTKSRIIIS
ncbi:MAG: hypothetical protein OXU51_08540 [Candidatus Poribacteria bacterium]|nr:hypothetical protein [Candidatus Poribacteria bacterium]